jgi:hypothetical protein
VDATALAANNESDAAGPRSYTVWIGVAAIALAVVVGFAFGSRRSDVATMTGTAMVGNHVASIKSGDTYYGVRDSVAWFDTSGSFHEDGWPDCLTSGSQVNVQFGVVPVTAPESGLTFNDVTYIDCRSA